MQNNHPNQLTIVDAQRALRAFELTALELVEACLSRIDQRESEVSAWVEVDADGARQRAQVLDSNAKLGNWQGPLHGIPVGVKDIFDVAGLPTRGGTAAWPVTDPATDAVSVGKLIDAGAIVLGKTVTTAFATGDPGPTRNPWKLTHTPGGSSSGSAAAVADGMCLAALGTQTAGSIIRPCSFNGLAGFKPRHGQISVDGVIALSWRLDHVGALTRDVHDSTLLWQVLTDSPFQTVSARQPSRLWRVRDFFDANCEPLMLERLDKFCAKAQASGVEIIEDSLPPGCADILDTHRVIMASEVAASHATNFASHEKRYPPRIRALIKEGQDITATDYLHARQHRRQTLAAMNQAMSHVDAVICPAATGPAPEGISYTGDRHANIPSSFWGLPVACFSAGRAQDGMPLGLQVMSVAGEEQQMFDTAMWCEELMGTLKHAFTV